MPAVVVSGGDSVTELHVHHEGTLLVPFVQHIVSNMPYAELHHYIWPEYVKEFLVANKLREGFF